MKHFENNTERIEAEKIVVGVLPYIMIHLVSWFVPKLPISLVAMMNSLSSLEHMQSGSVEFTRAAGHSKGNQDIYEKFQKSNLSSTDRQGNLHNFVREMLTFLYHRIFWRCSFSILCLIHDRTLGRSLAVWVASHLPGADVELNDRRRCRHRQRGLWNKNLEENVLNW